ncbi:hypothetical protein AO386_25905 [Pseudomonas syringae ICMP 11292]|nr:hypothetical protein AO386_25905 [Pseudomonas syringae ICMP 11292]
MLAALVFDLGKQQAGVVVAITQLAAVGVDAAQLVALGGDFAVSVIGERAGGAAGQGDLRQAVGCVPLVAAIYLCPEFNYRYVKFFERLGEVI